LTPAAAAWVLKVHAPRRIMLVDELTRAEVLELPPPLRYRWGERTFFRAWVRRLQTQGRSDKSKARMHAGLRRWRLLNPHLAGR
jgi:hypothetical protein